MKIEFVIKVIVLILVLMFLFIRSKLTVSHKFTPRFMIKYVIIAILFIFYFGSFFDFAQLNSNPYLRILFGFPIVFFGAFLFFWAHIKLGKNWSPVIEKKFPKSKKLVKIGPYKYVRHPIYSASFIIIIGFGFLTANWFFMGVPLLILFCFYAYKIPKEEKSLIDNFGKKYLDYMKTTGGVVPKLIKK